MISLKNQLNQSTPNFKLKSLLKISSIILLFVLNSLVFAQNTTQLLPKGVETPSTGSGDPDNVDSTSSLFLKAKPSITIKSISPSHGPQTGETRVTVRGGPFTIYKDTYPNPKCRFGSDSMIVSASYITCLPQRPKAQDREGKKDSRTNTCIQCEESPPSLESKPVAFTVSLTGDFSDVSSTVEFYYYKPSKVSSIKPIFGPKDGETLVQVWGENFQDFGEDVTCSFGTKSVSAQVHDSGYITCVTPQSDVVQRAMPFSISLNSQQQSKDRIDYWYYNDPQVTLLLPDTGPERGGNTIDVRGNNFKPYRSDLGEPDMSNSTFCYFTALGAYRRATVLNSTRLTCKVPESYYYRETAVEITLNAADRTDDNTLYHYYKPPFLFDAQPSQGPVSGKTQVKVVGTNFTDTGNITCRFGKKTVSGKYLSSSEILCISPQVSDPGFVDLTVSFYAGLDSAAIQYLYYQTPVVTSILPTSGPDYGFTQIAVTGKNFVDLGNDLPLCVFNRTIFTNATVMSDTLILCDSPSLLDNQGYSQLHDGGLTYFIVDISIDGGLEFSKSQVQFAYYRDPILNSISPQLGPISGGTIVTINATGFTQKAISKRLIRLGILEVEPISFTNESVTFQAPNVDIPMTTVVSVSLNGQQFTKQLTVNCPEKQLTYDYYALPYISFYNPHQGPTNGGTSMKVEGFGFRIRRPHLQDRLWARFYDQSTNKQFSTPIEIKQSKLGSDTFQWLTPAVSSAQDVLLQISLNNQDWHDARNPNDDGGYTYYISPHVTKLTPSFGHVKATQPAIVQITGTGFACLDNGCPGLTCRFGNNPGSYIYSKANFTSQENIQCFAPIYTKPDVLNLEISINGESFTSDNLTYGYFDPFVIDAIPKLISTDGSTQVQIKGLGFVDSGQSMSLFSNDSNPIICQTNNNCSKTATFQDKNTLLTPTFQQSEVKYQSTGQSVMWDPIYIDATVIGDGFTDNQVEIFYYDDPQILSTNINESPANIQSQVLISLNFKSNNMQRLAKYATPMCRFSQGSKIYYSEGLLIAYPLTQDKDPNLINTIHCKTPVWDLDSYYYSEKATLDISLNGQNYLGKQAFTFLRNLILHRDVPMSGPQEVATQVKLYGQGFRFDKGSADVKWGIVQTENIPSSDVQDYYYYLDKFLDQNSGSQELRAYQTESLSFKRVDSSLIEGGDYDQVIMQSQLQDLTQTLQGPAYLGVGIDEYINKTFYNQTAEGDVYKTVQQIQTYNYNPQNVEYYLYKNPTFLRMHPRSGLTKGDTLVEVIGYDFKYMPEYGIVPHCKFGDKVVRAYFDSTVRLVCKSPQNSNTISKLPFEISLNGVDWSTTGFTFSYYDEPIMTDIYPDMGSIAGSEEIYIKGDKFTNITDPEEFMCKFTPTTLQIPPKTVKAKYINSTTIMCTSPGGWTEADKVILQITWNGADYDQNNFKYSFYSIHRAFPRSGPSNGKGGDIIIYGQGFRDDTSPKCMLNDTYYEPTSVNENEIRCPMPAAEGGDSYFGNVNFAVTANGISWNNFDGGFQYYEQPIVEDIDPKTGPSSGIGIINFYGQNFRADYPLAELGCKIKNGTGRAFFVSTRQVKCVVENMPLLSEDDDPLPAQVSLNSYSYTEVGDDTYFRPYGVILLQPNSGPVGGLTTVIVQGQGFIAEEGATPRCRFGTPANFAIVEAQILSYTRIACRTPESLALTPTSALPRDVPFSIALSSDEFNPWTKTSHKFRFYYQPIISNVLPEEVEVGRIIEIYIFAAEDSEFFEPMPLSPVDSTNLIDEQEEQPQQLSSGGLSAIKCKFGRFGESTAVLINSTTIKCTTPPTDESPDSIYRETVIISVAMNGQDFLESTSEIEFTFIGTAPYISFATIVLTLLAIGFVGFAGTLCTSDRFQLGQLREKSIPNRARGANAYGGQLRQNISNGNISEN